MKFSSRPSYKELERKLSSAKKALSENKGVFGPNIEKLVSEFIQLKIDNAEEIWPLLSMLLEEITPEDYAGPHPPMLSFEPTLMNTELYIFLWKSKKLGKNLYIKFAIKNDYFYYVSLHESKKPKKCYRLV